MPASNIEALLREELKELQSMGSGNIANSVTRYSSLDATGQSVLSAESARKALSIQNVGQVEVEVYYNTDGSGAPTVVLAAGGSDDDGLGGMWIDERWNGAVWLKAPLTGGKTLVGSY